MYTDSNLPDLNQITCLKKSTKKAEEKKNSVIVSLEHSVDGIFIS